MTPERSNTKAESRGALLDVPVIEDTITPTSERKRRMAVSESDILPPLVSAMHMIESKGKQPQYS